GERIVASLLCAWVDVDPADTNRGRAEKAQPRRCRLATDLHQAQLRLDPQLAAEPLDQCERRFVIGAAIEIEDLHQRRVAHERLPLMRRDGDRALRRRRTRAATTTTRAANATAP